MTTPTRNTQFKTLKYYPAFPDRFGSVQDSRSFCQDFFRWYNNKHRHSGIGLMTPESVHYGLAKPLYEHRKTVLKAAFEKDPSRFKGKIPKPPNVPKATWINPPSSVAVGVEFIGTAVSFSLIRSGQHKLNQQSLITHPYFQAHFYL